MVFCQQARDLLLGLLLPLGPQVGPLLLTHPSSPLWSVCLWTQHVLLAFSAPTGGCSSIPSALCPQTLCC